MSENKSNRVDNLYDPAQIEADLRVQEENIVIPVIEEQVEISKEVVETGRVRLIKEVKEISETVNIPLTEEEIIVERRPVNRYVNEAPAIRQEGDSTIYSVLKEVLVVEKKLLLVEEVHVKKQQRTSLTNETVILRSESVHVERESLHDKRSE